MIHSECNVVRKIGELPAARTDFLGTSWGAGSHGYDRSPADRPIPCVSGRGATPDRPSRGVPPLPTPPGRAPTAPGGAFGGDDSGGGDVVEVQGHGDGGHLGVLQVITLNAPTAPPVAPRGTHHIGRAELTTPTVVSAGFGRI